MRAIADRLSGPQDYRTTRKHMPLLARFGSKLVLDILPAALASVIGGILFTHFQIGRMTSPPAAEQATPLSAEVLTLVRDEHDAIIGYLKSQMTAEKNRLAAQDAETARAVADAKAEKEKAVAVLAAAETRLAEVKLASTVTGRSAPAPVPQPKLAPLRTKPATAAASSRAPLVIAQAGQQAGQAAEQNVAQSDAAPASDRLARDPDSLLAKTLDLKDQVVAATRNAVAAIGDAFASVGGRFGGAASGPTSRQFSSDS
jgi:hypothetical protein